MNWVQIWYLLAQGRISWEEVHRVVRDQIARQLQAKNAVPDLIVGIGRGGLICAGMLCSELTGRELERNGKDDEHSTRIRLASIDTQAIIAFTDGGAGKRTYSVERIEVGAFDESFQPTEKIALVVAQSYTGFTLNEARQRLIAQGVPEENITMIAAFLQRVPPNQSVITLPDIKGKVVSARKTMPWKTHKITTDRY